MDGAQFAVVAVTFLLVFSIIFTYGVNGPSVMVMLTIAGLAAMAAFVPFGGRKLVHWVPITVSFFVRRMSKQHRFYRSLMRPRPAGNLALPGAAARLRLYIEASSRTPMVHDPSDKTLTVVARLDYQQILLDDEAEQERKSHAWGRALSTMGTLEGVVRIQTLERTLPDSGVGVESFWNQWPSKAPKDSWVRRQYEELLADSSTIAERHESLLSITVSLTNAERAVRDNGGGLMGGSQVVVGVMRSVENAMRNVGVGVQWLTERELAVVIRSTYEPSRAAELDRQDNVPIATAGPIGTEDRWSEYRIDTDWAQVWECTAMPRIPQMVGFLRPLVFTPGVNATLSMIFEPVALEKALAEADREVTKEDSAQQDRARLGRVDTIVHQREREAATQHLDDVSSGYGSFRYCLLVAVMAPSQQELAAAASTVRAAGKEMMMELRLAYGQQAALFPAAALPLGRAV